MKYKSLKHSLLVLLVLCCGSLAVAGIQKVSQMQQTDGDVTIVTAVWDWQNDLPVGIQESTNYQGVEVDIASTIDGIAMHVDATGGKLYCVGRNNAQCNEGTVLQVPVVSIEDVVTVVGYPGYSHYNFNGGEDLIDENSYTAKAADVRRGYVVINGKGGYLYSVKVEQHQGADTGADEPIVEPTMATVTFTTGDAVGTAPEAVTKEEGTKIAIPANYTLYTEGKTLTAWTDGAAEYAPGTDYTVPGQDVTLTPVFTDNEVSLADRTEPVTVKWNFRRDQGAPVVASQNGTGFWVAQAVVDGKTIDVKADFDTNNGGKFANGSWTDWAQLNKGTRWTLPSCKGATVSIEAFSAMGADGKTATTIDGQSDYTSAKTVSYTVAGAAETVDVVIGDDGQYYRYIQVVLPVVQSQGGESYDNAEASILWPMSDPAGYSASTATPDGVFATVGVDLGAVRLMDQNGNENTTGTSNVSPGVTFSHMRPTNNASDYVTWNVKPAAGLTFTPKKVTAYIVRFGTDAENGVTFSVKAGEGDAINLGTFTAPRNNQSKDDDKFGKNANYAENGFVEILLTEAQQQALTSGETLSLMGTVGVGNKKAGGIAQVSIEGTVSGTKADIATYTLTTAASPAEGGDISVYPVSDSYEQGSEVTVTATERFGYDFVSWTDAEGNIVSQEPKFKHTMEADVVLTANFVQVPTYELALTVDGTNDYMVAIDPAPEMVGDKKMYEAGTAVQLTANQYEGLVTFSNWSDGETASSKLVSMDSNVTLTAVYAQADIIAGWDFYQAGGNGRKADFASADNEAAALNLVNTESGETQGWLDKSTVAAGGYESFKGAAVNWRTGSGTGDVGHWHWQTKLNAADFTDICLQFQMLYNYNAYQTYDVEFSTDGQQWAKVGSITMSGAKSPASFSGKLPEAANNQAELYIRLIADKSSAVDGTPSANDGNALAMFFITGTPKLVDDGVAPVLVSSVPVNGATGVSATGKIVLTFDERIKLDEGAKATLGSLELTPTVNGKTVTFEYKGLEYSTDYTFTLPQGTVADLTGNYVAKPITLGFTTMVRPSVAKGLYDAVVGDADGLVAALKAAEQRADKNVRFRIFLKNGTYVLPAGAMKHYTHTNSNDGTVLYDGDLPDPITYINASNISLIGESRDGVVITNSIDNTKEFAGQWGTTNVFDGIGNSDVLQFGSSVRGTYLQDLTVKSGMRDARGRNLAIQDKGSQTIYKNTVLFGYQDTWTSNNDNGLYYFEGGQVRGRTDYLCGKGDAFFNGIELRQIAGGYAAVPSKSIKYGYTFKDCVISGEGSGVDGNYTLGRPWGSGTPVALFIDTKMKVVPSAIGWNEMSGGWPKRFAEFNSTTASGAQVDLSGRKKVFGDGHENNPVLTAEEALEAGNLHNMFGEWDPTLATEQAPAPTDVSFNKATMTISWAASDYAFCWAIVKDENVIGFTTEPSYVVDDANAHYAVRAANEMGGLGEAVPVLVGTGIETVGQSVGTADDAVYNLQGMRVKQAQKGLFIRGGKKVVK